MLFSPQGQWVYLLLKNFVERTLVEGVVLLVDFGSFVGKSLSFECSQLMRQIDHYTSFVWRRLSINSRRPSFSVVRNWDRFFKRCLMQSLYWHADMYCLCRAQNMSFKLIEAFGAENWQAHWKKWGLLEVRVLVVCLVTTEAQLKNLLTAQLWADNYTTQLLDIHTLINKILSDCRNCKTDKQSYFEPRAVEWICR